MTFNILSFIRDPPCISVYNYIRLKVSSKDSHIGNSVSTQKPITHNYIIVSFGRSETYTRRRCWTELQTVVS